MDDKTKFEFIPLKFSHNPLPSFSESRRYKWVNYGDNNLFPNKLVELYNSANVHSSIVKMKTEMVVGNGLSWNKDNPALNEFFSNITNFGINKLIKNMALDILLFDTISLQARWSRDGESVAKLSHLDFTKVRMSQFDETTDEVETCWVSRDWSSIRKAENKPSEFFLFNKELSQSNPTQVIYWFDEQPGIEYYPLPQYFAGINYINLEAELSNYYNKFVENGLSSNLIITMFGDMSPQERAEVRRQIEKNMQGSDNAGNFFLAIVESPEVAPVIQPLGTADNTQLFQTLQNLVFTQVMGAHRITAPEIVGLPSGNGVDLGGDANKLAVSYKFLEYSAIQPIRKKIEKFFSWILDINGIQYQEGDFSIESNMPVEEIDNEILTINERRAIKGLEPLEGMDIIKASKEEQ